MCRIVYIYLDLPCNEEKMAPGETDMLHERLVAYVHTLAHGSRRGVWGEHSYARARIGASSRGGPRVRALLAPPPPRPAPHHIDVVSAPSPPPSPPAPPAPCSPPSDDDTSASDSEWEERVAALAPSAAHARLADAAVEALRGMRLARLVAGGRSARREQAREAAGRLRRALAPLWVGGGGAPAWLHGALAAHLPRAHRRLYDEAVGELRRAVPRLAERMTGSSGPPAALPAPAPRAAGGGVGPESSPWLVWVSSGSAALDVRWEPRLAALVHTRVLRGAAGAAGAEAAPPEAWCAAAAGCVRAALTDALAEAGSRSVILGGVGAGCAVALVLARGAGGAGRAEGGVRGCVLAAPPLLTAEGARDAVDDALHACRLPLLVVAGSHAADCTRAVGNNVCEGGAGGTRRLLEVRGADGELRLPARLRARHHLPQHALDAALVEECVRWAIETAEQEEAPPSPPPPSAAAPPERRRPPLPAVVREIDLTEEEYAHLPPAAPALDPAATAPAPIAPAARDTAQNSRGSDNGVGGRVVSRVTGGTPLALLPPRRGAGAGAPSPSPSPLAPGPLAAADIMQLPIVFADDDPPPAAPPAPGGEAGAGGAGGAPLTVTSGKPTKRGAGGTGAGAGAGAGGAADAGSIKFTRVILAKQGAGGAAAAAVGAAGSAPRRLLLRRGVRLVPRRP